MGKRNYKKPEITIEICSKGVIRAIGKVLKKKKEKKKKKVIGKFIVIGKVLLVKIV